MDTSRDASKGKLSKLALLERTLPGEVWVWFDNIDKVISQDEADGLIEEWGEQFWSFGDKPE